MALRNPASHRITIGRSTPLWIKALRDFRDHLPVRPGQAGLVTPDLRAEVHSTVDRGASATADELEAELPKHNPIDRLAPLAKAKVPIFHIHGDKDRVVPLDKNSAIIKERYDKLGGPMTLEVVHGQGHNMWSGWFQSQNLVDFVIRHASK